MKKLFLLATLAVALVFAGCANNSSKDSDKDGEKTEQKAEQAKQDEAIAKLPKDVREAAIHFEKEFKADSAFQYKGITVDDEENCLIYTLGVSKDDRNGMSLKKWLRKNGLEIADIKRSFLRGLDEDDAKACEALKDNQYKLIFRFVGDGEEDVIEVYISHKDLPDGDELVLD